MHRIFFSSCYGFGWELKHTFNFNSSHSSTSFPFILIHEIVNFGFLFSLTQIFTFIWHILIEIESNDAQVLEITEIIFP